MVASAGRTEQALRGQQTSPAQGLCLRLAACGGPQCQRPRVSQPTSRPGDAFQAAGAGGQLARVEPQAAAAVRGLLAGPGLDAVAGVLQREGELFPSSWPRTPSQPRHSVLTLLRAPAP